MEENQHPANVPSTPSRLRPPSTKRVPMPVIDTTLGVGIEPSLVNPVKDTGNHHRSTKAKIDNAAKSNISLPPLVSTDGTVRTYKTTAAVTGRPAPVTKAPPRPSRPPVSSTKTNVLNVQDVSQRPGWDLKGRLEDMQKLMTDMSKRMDESTESNQTYQFKMQELQRALSQAEDERNRLENVLKNKAKEAEELEMELKKLKRTLEVLCRLKPISL